MLLRPELVLQTSFAALSVSSAAGIRPTLGKVAPASFDSIPVNTHTHTRVVFDVVLPAPDKILG